jgi:sarcosine oxidase
VQTWDVIVVGLGAMGSAAAAELAARGLSVLGLDRHTPPHTFGSSHGESRIIREAYFEHPQYVPLVRRAYELWAALERDSGTRLFVRTGGVNVGPADGVLVTGALASVRAHGLPHELLDAGDLAQRVPALRPREEWVAVWEPRAGVLFPERCVAAQLARAASLGADLRTGATVDAWEVAGGRARVRVAGEWLQGGRLVLAAGAWAPTLLAGAGAPLTVARQAVHWFDAGPEPAALGPARLPVFLVEHAPARMLYGFPELREVGPGVKVAIHHEGVLTTADTVSREVSAEERAEVEVLLRRHVPGVRGPHLRSAVCLYTNTPDQDFLIDWHPSHGQVLVVSACSGHGFKFASALGEVVADFITGREGGFDLTPFRWGRWAR